MNKKLLKVQDYDNLYRDAETGAILNMSDVEAHRKMKEEIIKKRVDEKRKENEINTLKNDVREMKEMFKQILDKLGNGNN